MMVQRRGIKLGEQVDLIHSRVQAVATWDIHQPVFTAKRDGWFTAEFVSGITCASATAHYNANNFLFHDLLLLILGRLGIFQWWCLCVALLDMKASKTLSLFF